MKPQYANTFGIRKVSDKEGEVLEVTLDISYKYMENAVTVTPKGLENVSTPNADQVASIVMLRQPGNASKLGYFMSADKVKFRRVVVPGDTLIIEAELTKMRGNIGQATARCLVNGQVVSEAELKFGLQDA